MYMISNQQMEEAKRLLTALNALKGTDNKTVNTKRRASILIKGLSKCEVLVLNNNHNKSK